MKSIDVKQKILAANEAAAGALRDRFRASGTLVVNLISSPGSGKTTLLEATAARLGEHLSMATIEGDIATELDAERLRRAEMPAYQILTGGACHLDARQVESALGEASFPEPLDILFVENVGNLICPTSYDLGEDFKVAVLSVVEGDDKPFKYPAIFSRAHVTVISKADLLPHVDFDLERARDQIRALNPEGHVLVTSVRTGEGLHEWCRLLEDALADKRAATAAT
jgi:hydrogenase nickel incorporation protein HypB